MAKKGSMPNFETMDDYIAHQPKETQKVLQELRNIIKAGAPDAVEILNYKVPAFTLVPGGKKGPTDHDGRICKICGILSLSNYHGRVL